MPEETDQSQSARKNLKRPRVRVLDFLRGFSLLSMIGYHTMYDLVVLFGVRAAWYFETPGYLWQQSICWVFILVSGASMQYSRKPFRRGGTVLLCGVALTVATLIAMPTQAIWFGVLHFMGAAMLITGALRPLLEKIPPVAGAICAFALFLLLKGVPSGSIGIGDMALLELPAVLYSQAWTFPLGFHGSAFASSDYFPLVPWLFLFLTGWFVWARVKEWAPRSNAGGSLPEWLGRRSLLVYMLHQPVIYGVLLILARIGVLG